MERIKRAKKMRMEKVIKNNILFKKLQVMMLLNLNKEKKIQKKKVKIIQKKKVKILR